jgi:perosamine synthetase
MIPLFKVRMPVAVDGPLLETLHSGFIGQGPKVKEFEAALAGRLDNPRVLTLNNGTSGIHLALRLIGVGRGDLVVSTPMTCTASNMPVLERGADIVWTDINPKTGNMDPESLERMLKRHGDFVGAVICVHWAGYPCDLKEILDIAGEYGIPVIQDGAHAFGASYQGKPIGSIGDFTMFSFQAIKHLTTVDGGALTCSSDIDYERGKLLRWYGIDRENTSGRRDSRIEDDIPEYGYKFHMNDVAATIGLAQLNTVDEVLYAHRENAKSYDAMFANAGLKHVRPLQYEPDRLSSYWVYTVLVDDRESFAAHMTAAGVHVSRVHARNDKHSCFCDSIAVPMPGLEEFDAHQISIPCGWWVTLEQRVQIFNAMVDWDEGQ